MDTGPREASESEAGLGRGSPSLAPSLLRGKRVRSGVAAGWGWPRSFDSANPVRLLLKANMAPCAGLCNKGWEETAFLEGVLGVSHLGF